LPTSKFVYLLWARPGTRVAADRAAARDLLLRRCAPRLLGLLPERLVVYVNDPESGIRSPSPFRPGGAPICATAELWLDATCSPEPFEGVLREAGLTVAGYLVEESVYREYGGNRHAGPRAWPDGQRSPGLALVSLLERPVRHEAGEWMRRWHGVMSPVSEGIQPRTRYVRNLVVRSVTDGAPPFAGIVVECWPSPRHVTNPFLFYGASGPVDLAVNMARILRAVRSFLDISRIRTSPVGEYFLKTGLDAEATPRKPAPGAGG